MKSIPRLFYFGLVVLPSFFMMACQTNELKQYEKLKLGMDKADVLEIMGSPRRSERWRGKDRWTYIFYTDRQRYEKEVHFDNGVSDYVGELYKPEISAEEQDRIYASSNKALEEKWQKDAATHRQESSNFMNSSSMDASGETIRYVPEFKPVQ